MSDLWIVLGTIFVVGVVVGLVVLYIIGLVASYDEYGNDDGLKFWRPDPKERKTPLTPAEKQGLKDILQGRG